jgi:hypothetical protein
MDTLLIHDIAPNQIVTVIDEKTIKENVRSKQPMEVPGYDLTVFDDVPRSPQSAYQSSITRIPNRSAASFEVLEIGCDWQPVRFPRHESTIKNPNIRDASLLQS